MASFQKPENALKRAEELIDVGKKQDALDTLHLAIQHRKWRNNWTATIEKIMIRHLELCVELKKMRTAREGLHQYRTTCQAANIGSLELVVQTFRKAAEDKVSEAKKQQEDLKMAELDDLDEMEAPQTILLRAIQAHDTRQQSQDRDVHAHFRFLWDTYRVVLDVLKSNVRLEEVYHETAQHAFEFCRVNKRPTEFKRLCETLRKNYQELFKRAGPVPVHQVNPNNPDTVTRNIDTRFSQLRTATELDLWREAYNTATEIFDLMNKAKTKPKTRSEYYEFLGQIFWKSENYLFHAFACLKNVLYVKAVKRDLSKDDLQTMASKAVMAMLCCPFQKGSDIHTTLELTAEGASSPYEKAKKHAQLFNAQSVPTRDTIIGQLLEKNLLQHAAEPCQRLFALIESDFTPLSLCQDAKPYLDMIAENPDICEGKLGNYITPVKKIIFFRLMKQLSEVYANMTIENFERAASIVPFSIAEKWMANAARQQGINIQINYREKAIVFGAPRKVDMKSMRQPLIEIGFKLQQAMQRVAPEEQHKKEKLEKAQLSQNIVDRIEQETRLIRQRKEEIERRKEESERRKEQQEREQLEKIKKQEAKEAEQERKRQEEERARREADREEQKRRDAKMKETKEMLEQMKNREENKPSNLKIAGKKIGDIQAEDIEGISFDQIEKAREAQVQRERQEKIRQRKLESKRVDHLSRAIREEEKKKLDDWADEVYDQDSAFLDEAQDRMEQVEREKHGEAVAEKKVLEVFKASKAKWVAEMMKGRIAEYEKKVAEREERCIAQVVQNKIERAREFAKMSRKEREQREAEHKKAEEERERKRREEERRREQELRDEEEREAEERRRAEEAERKAAEREAREARRREQDEANERVARKQREREREIEERQNAERGGGGGGSRKEPEEGGWRAREAARTERGGGEDNWRRGGGGNDDADNWRSSRGGGAQRNDREEEAGGRQPWRPSRERGAPQTRADQSDTWRRDRDEEKPEESSAWSRPRAAPSRRTEDDDAPPPARKEAPWARPAAAAREPEPAADDDDGFQAVTKGKKKTKEPEPKAEDDDDGFQTVTAGKKKGKKGAEEEGGGERGTAPWRRGADEEPSRAPSSRDAWKSKGREEGGGSGAAPPPWRRNA